MWSIFKEILSRGFFGPKSSAYTRRRFSSFFVLFLCQKRHHIDFVLTQHEFNLIAPPHTDSISSSLFLHNPINPENKLKNQNSISSRLICSFLLLFFNQGEKHEFKLITSLYFLALFHFELLNEMGSVRAKSQI